MGVVGGASDVSDDRPAPSRGTRRGCGLAPPGSFGPGQKFYEYYSVTKQ